MKPHLEFFRVAWDDDWEPIEGYPPGMVQKILASDFDEIAKRGSRTRLLRIHPGAYSTRPFVHDYWEEVFVVEGDLIVGSDSQGKGGEPFAAHTYACRPPGVFHGPFTSKHGCTLFEVHFYERSTQATRISAATCGGPG